MKIPTQKKILDHLDKARYELQGVVDKSMDELHAVDELRELITHIRDIDAEGYSVEG